jgi:hypothetical protein
MRYGVLYLILFSHALSATTFQIGFTSLALDRTYATQQLEQQIFLQLEAMTEHLMSLERQKYHQKRNKADNILRLQQELSVAQQAYDRLRLEFQPNLKVLMQKQSALTKQKKALVKAQDAPLIAVARQASITVQRVDERYSDSLALRYPNVDVWVGGSIQLLRPDSLYLMIELHDSLTSESVVIYRGAVPPINIMSLSRVVIDGGRHLLLGRDWAALEVVGEDLPVTMAMQWGEQRIRFPMSFENLTPGQGTFIVAGLGRERVKQDLTLLANQRTRYAFSAAESLQDHILIESVPKGARIYIDGLYVGVAPLFIPVGQHQVVSAHLDNHLPVARPAGKMDELKLVLGRNYEEQSAFIKEQQRRFRFSSTFFALSLLGPLVLYNFSLDYRQQSAKFSAIGNVEQALRAEQLARYFDYGLWVSAGLSGGLLGLSIYHLYGYVQSSQIVEVVEEDDKTVPMNSH